MEGGREGGFRGEFEKEKDEGEEEDGRGPKLRRERNIVFGRRGGRGTEGGMGVDTQVGGDADAGCHKGHNGDCSSFGETG